jgi:hypothetical protein
MYTVFSVCVPCTNCTSICKWECLSVRPSAFFTPPSISLSMGSKCLSGFNFRSYGSNINRPLLEAETNFKSLQTLTRRSHEGLHLSLESFLDAAII